MTRGALGATDAFDSNRRRGLTRQRIVEAALDLVDQDGLDSLSMRRLGRALDVEAMSLYAHVESKEEILEEILDLLFKSIPLPDARDRPWDEVTRELWQRFRQVLLAHPNAVPLFATRAARSIEALSPIELSLATLRAGGFGRRDAVDAHRTLMSFTIGYVLSEVSVSADPEAHPNSWGTAAYALRDLPRDTVPNLAELSELALRVDADDQFPVCLDAILVGLGQRQDPRRPPTD